MPTTRFRRSRIGPGSLRLAVVVSILGLLLPVILARAQDVKPITDSIPLWEPGHAITTSIKDALPVVTSLRGYDEDFVRPIPDDWRFAPGYYRSVIRSYCLHAGAYGPVKGDGYLIAPLKGDRAPLIRNIVLRSQQNPGIDQQDVQRLIWGIEDGLRWDSYDANFKLRVAPLLDAREIAVLNLEPARAEVAGQVKRSLAGLMSGVVGRPIDTYADMRSKIASITSFQELEAYAVKRGPAPWGKDSRKEVQPGPWAYVGDSLYIRVFPVGYDTTTVEVYRVVPAKWIRDGEGRITRFDSGGYIIDTTYADELSSETVHGKVQKVWRFKTITFRHPDGRTNVIENRGYVVAGECPEDWDVPGGGPEAVAQGGLDDMEHYKDGLKTAVDPTDLKGKLDWNKDHLNRVSSAYDAASSIMAGAETADPTTRHLDPTHHTATPANTSSQRLLLSNVKKG